MATSTKAPEDRYTDESHDPSQQLYDREFNDLAKNYDKSSADPSQENRNIDKLRDSEKNPDSPERQAIGDTAAGKAATTAVSTVGGPVGTVASKILAQVKTKKGITGTILGVLLGVVVLLFFIFGPAGILLNLKENGSRWMSKYQELGHSSRVRQQLKSKFFFNPDDCRGFKVVCRYKSGVSDGDIKKLTDAGFRDIKTAKASSGKSYIVSVEFTDETDGKSKVATVQNFEELHKTNLSFRSISNNAVNVRAITFRGKASLAKFNMFGVDRKSPLGDETTREKLRDRFRTYMYSDSGDSSRLRGTAEEDKDNQQRLAALDEIDESISEEAERIRERIVIDGPDTSFIPDASNLTSTAALQGLAAGGLSGGIKGTVMGYFAGVDSFCSLYKTIRLASYGAKLYAARSLIKYAGLFMTLADKGKMNEAKIAQISFAAGILLKKSTIKGSAGKDFSSSEGANLIFNKKVGNPAGLARFSVGTTSMKALSEIQAVMNSKGVSANTCRIVKSWWGQGLLGIAGIVSCIGTAGTGCAAGAVQGVLVGSLIGYVTELMLPLLIQYAAGAVVPDAINDPEGGYGAGNAIAAGLGAFGGQIGIGNGSKYLSETEFAVLNQTTTIEQRTIAAVDAHMDRQAGVFNVNNPMSYTNQLAVATAPLLSTGSSFGSYFNNIMSFTANTFAQAPGLISPRANASPTDDYRGVYCVDEDIINSKVAHDAFCNPITGPDPTTIDNPNYSPELVANYMATNNFIDPETGDVTSSVYQDFLNACTGADGEIHPLTSDGFGVDIENGGLDTSQCTSTDEQYKYFWLYTEDEAMYSGINDTFNDTLGKSDPNTVTDTTTGGAVSGDAISLAKQLLEQHKAGKINLDAYRVAADVADGSTAFDQVQDTAAGRQAKLSTRCGYASQLPKTVALDVNIMKFLVDLGNKTKYSVNALAGQCHSGVTSDHHTGKAVDFGCPLDLDIANRVGQLYGVSRNSETCANPDQNHYHYSIDGA